MRGISPEHLPLLCGAAGLVALIASAWLRRGPAVTTEPVGADGVLRAGFGAAAAPAVAASALSALTALGAWAIGGGPALLALALVAALLAVSMRAEWTGLLAAQVAAIAGASWLGETLATGGAIAADVPAALPTRAALLPIVLASFGALTSALATIAARAPRGLPGSSSDEEAPALSRALLRPAVVASVLVLVCAAALGDVLDLRLAGASMRGAQVAVVSGLAYGLLLLVAGAPWPATSGGARGEALLQLGARFRSAPAQWILGLAVVTASFGAAGLWGVSLAAAGLVATAAMPLAATRFCRAHGATWAALEPVSLVLGRSTEAAWGVAAALALGAAAAEPLLRDAIVSPTPLLGGAAGGALAALGVVLTARAVGARPALAVGVVLAAVAGAFAGRVDLPGVFAGVSAGALLVAGRAAAGPVGLRACLPLVVLAACALLATPRAAPRETPRDGAPGDASPALVSPVDDPEPR